MKRMLFLATLLSSQWAYADQFDITMDVVGANESFDEAIVNQIALPFGKSESADRPARELLVPAGGDGLDGLEPLMGGSLEGAGGPDGGGTGLDGMGVDSAIDGIEQNGLELDLR